MEGLVCNTRISAKHIGTKANDKADALSRLDWKRFRTLGPFMNEKPTAIPSCIWPVQKIWIK